MDSYDPNLIFDLAAGTLPEAEARAAEAALDAAGRAELEAQRVILAAIAAAPPVGMTDIERAHLHRVVAAEVADTTRELSPARVAVSPAPPRSRRSVRWTRWASAAAAAAMFVGVVAVGSQLTGSSDDTADTIATAAADLTTTTVAAAGGDGGNRSATTAAGALALGDGSSEGIAAIPEEDASLTFDAASLPTAPVLEQARDSSDLEELKDFFQDLGRSHLEPVEDVTSLPCYAVAVEDDDLEIIQGANVMYVGPNGELLPGIGYSDAGTDSADALIRVYDIATCDAVVAIVD